MSGFQAVQNGHTENILPLFGICHSNPVLDLKVKPAERGKERERNCTAEERKAKKPRGLN